MTDSQATCVLALRYMQERSEREPPAHNKSLHQ